jgi:proteasome lid subunit RPN8/RPN11
MKQEQQQELQALSANIVQSAEDDEEYKFWRKMRRLGLVISLVYHCNRCNHIWLP